MRFNLSSLSFISVTFMPKLFVKGINGTHIDFIVKDSSLFLEIEILMALKLKNICTSKEKLSLIFILKLFQWLRFNVLKDFSLDPSHSNYLKLHIELRRKG